MKEQPDLYGNIEYNDYARYMLPITSFMENYDNMKENRVNNTYSLEDADKYFHALSNCQSGQSAIVNALLGMDMDNAYNTLGQTLALDYGKEIWDLIDKNHLHKRNNYNSNHQDSRDDIGADHKGLWQGIYHPFSDCRILLDDIGLRTPGIKNKY